MFYIDRFPLGCNVILFCGMIGLFYVVRTNPLFERKQNILFTIAIFINSIALIVISLDYTYSISLDDSFYVYRRITSFLNFALSPTVPFLLYFIFHKGAVQKLVFLPLVVNFICCLLSIRYQIIFMITEQNTYARGPLFFLPILISIFYIILLIIQPASSHDQKKKKERLFLLGVIGMLSLGMFLEVQLGLFFVTWNASALCTILYYLMLNIHYFSLDALTGVSNRLMYNYSLDHVRSGNGCIIAMIDINFFKEINDKYGHEAGDECLIQFAKILSHSFAKTANLFRIGGDEFVLISKTSQMDRFELCLEKARADAAQAKISFACGYAAFVPGTDLQDLIVHIDQLMYTDKAAIKAQVQMMETESQGMEKGNP